MKKCPNCNLDVNNDIKICPNCQFDFENSSFKNIPIEKLNKRNKISYYLLSAVVILSALVPFLFRFSRGIDRANKREEALAQIYGHLEDGFYSFDQISQMIPDEAKRIKPTYDAFLNEIAPYLPKGHEKSEYIFDNKDQIIFVHYIADVKIADCDMQIQYFVSGEDFERRYSYIQEYNLDRKIDADDLRTFCQYTKVPQNILTNKLKDFMDHLENQTNPYEEISLDSGTLTLHYLGMGEINITYEAMEEKLR